MPIAVLRLVVVLLVVGAACGNGDPIGRRVQSSPIPTTAPSPTPTPTPEDTPTATTEPPAPAPDAPSGLAAARVRTVQIASLSQPLGMAVAPGDGALYVAEKTGAIRAIRGGQVDATPVLDLTGEVSGGSEQGLLGLAFSPDGAFLYVNFTDRDGHTHIREYAFAGGRARPGTARDVLFVEQPRGNHNGGHIVFGPDGNLWIGLGDGGGSGDPDNHGQRLDTLLGKVLRIHPRPQGAAAYTVPSDNPFVGRQGARSEIWAYGLRNPWRYSFDRQTRDLWIADVGQNTWEWVNYQRADSRGGENYGWNLVEGSNRFRGDPPPGHVPPIYEYRNDSDNCAVVGGYLYRGTGIPELRGAYVFGDFCGGRPRAFVQIGGRAEGHRFLGPQIPQLASFGQDHAGELYVTSLAGGVYRLEAAG